MVQAAVGSHHLVERCALVAPLPVCVGQRFHLQVFRNARGRSSLSRAGACASISLQWAL